MISQAIADGLAFLAAQNMANLLALFWYVILFEVPRYTLSFLAVGLAPSRGKPQQLLSAPLRVTAAIVGHNEADTIDRCVQSLREQSRPPDEIIVVSDGSTDQMAARVRELQGKGLIDQAHCTELRAGKAAGFNLALRYVTGDIVINVDCDSSLDRNAFHEILLPFSDPAIAAVSGNILVRNPKASLVATFQAIEYLISVSLGKQSANILDNMVCVSGAFGAYRCTALAKANGLDSGGGEDLDATLRLRKAGWSVLFAPDAVCYTDVPATLSALVRQRFRWERDAIRLRYRKHVKVMSPLSPQLNFKELFHECEFLLFNVAAAIALPVYLFWLVATYGYLAPVILIAAQLGLFVLDTFTLLLAAYVTPGGSGLSLLPFLPGYSVFSTVVMRFTRLAAYAQEWVLRASYKDPYVPDKVHLVRS